MEAEVKPRKSKVNAGIMKVAGMIGSLQMVNIFCSIVRAKLIALWIGPIGVGLFGVFNSALEMIAMIAQMGIRPSAVRELGKADRRSVPRIVASVRRTAFVLGMAGALLTLCCSPLLSRISFGDTSRWWGFAWLSVAILLMALNNAEGAVFQGLGRFRKLARCSMAGSVGGFLVSVPLFYWLRTDSIVPSILAYVICTWLAMGFYREKVPAPVDEFSAKERSRISRRLVTFGAYLTVMGVMNYGITYLFLAYLNAVSDEATIGYFQAGSTFINRYVSLVLTALAMEYLPRLSAHAHSPRRSGLMVSNQIFLSTIALTGVLSLMAALSPVIIRLFYSSEFMPVLPFLVLAGGATLLKGVSWCMAVEMMARGDGRTFLVTEIISGALHLGLGIFGFNAGGFFGLGLAYVVWYGLYTLMVWYVYRFRYGLRLYGPVLGVTAVAFCFVLPAVVLALAGKPYLGLPLALCAVVWSLVKLRAKFRGSGN